jgi:aryl sulfotransferase
MLVQSAQCKYSNWSIDSRRWQHYRPRPDDIVIATYQKCGTTWMQRIVGMLVFQTPEPMPIMQMSPWIDRRQSAAVDALIEAQTHRRFLKSHLPLDGLPFYDDVKYIHVARDGRDACLSYHQHCLGFTAQALERLNSVGMEDESIGRVYPEILLEPREFFHRWVTRGEVAGHEDGSPGMSFFHFEKSWSEARHLPNVLFVHYNDLKSDLSAEMRRIADFLEIAVEPSLWPKLVAAAEFESMRRDADALMPNVDVTFKEGSRTFFHKGVNERWRGAANEDDLAIYEVKAAAAFSPQFARWLAQGRIRVRRGNLTRP